MKATGIVRCIDDLGWVIYKQYISNFRLEPPLQFLAMSIHIGILQLMECHGLWRMERKF